ncbi:MAG: hypothetical protein ABIG95_06530 [Candidatus Woesearchaeota archaeon]
MVSAKEVTKGDYFRYKGSVLRVVRKESVNVGTHCHSKSKLIVQSMEGGSEKPMVFSHEDKIDLLEVTRSKAQVLSKTADGVQIMDLRSYETLDATASVELLEQLNENDLVTYADVEGKKIVMDRFR